MLTLCGLFFISLFSAGLVNIPAMENSVGIVETKTIRIVDNEKPLVLVSGKTIAPVDVAYETYGRLNEQGDNAVLICHALSGDAHAAGLHSPDDKKPGWWDIMIGPGKYIDTDKYFVVCSNCLGGCSGTTGPSSIDPSTNKPYGLDFPIITIADMVRVQNMLLDKLGVNKLLAVIGGSMGGMQVLQWAIDYPDIVENAIVIASTTRLGAQAIAFDAVGRHCILADDNFQNGSYHGSEGPQKGLAIARMIGHITYLSEEGMRKKFGRELRYSQEYSYDFDSEFSVETYLTYQGQSFVERFDADSYLYITKAMDYFDPARDFGSLQAAFKNIRSGFLIVSFTSDWLFPPAQSVEIVEALAANKRQVSYCNIDSPYGHDAFLLEAETLGTLTAGFIDSAYAAEKKRHSGAVDSEKISRQVDYDRSGRMRVDYEIIEQLIEPDTKVLDIGSGDGDLLARLIRDKNITSQGIEVDQSLTVHSVCRGLPIIQRDVELGLGLFGDDAFDYVILSQTVQTIMNTEAVFSELLRVGKKVIVSFPNFAHWKCRLNLMVQGVAPRTRELPFEWYNSPNNHFLSLKDFDRFCHMLGVRVHKRIPLIKTSVSPVRRHPNFFAEQAVYLISRNGK